MAIAKLTGSRALLGGGLIPQLKKIPIVTAPTGSEQDTGVDLPAKALVLDVFVDVTVVEATGGTKTLDVGLLSTESGGDADGFLDGISVATSTGLRKGTLVSTGQTKGALLRADESGAGVLVPEVFMSDSVTAKSVSYTAGDTDWVEFRGAIYIVYFDLS